MTKKRLFLILLLGVLSWTVVAEAPVRLRRIALVTGSNDGGEGLVRLKYAESDARSFASVMQELGGVRPQDLVLVVHPDVTRFEDALGRVRQMVASPREMDERRELVVYYSGHSDDDGLIFGKDRMPWATLRRELNDIPADVKIAILDSCSSGSLTRAKGGVSRPAFLFDASADMTGHAYLTSASAEEAAQESDRIGASFFTHYLISGMRGAADTVGDGVVTLNEAYAYAFQETLASTEKTQYGPQHPAYDINLTGSGDLVLTDLRLASAGLTVAEDVAGRLYLRDAQGTLAVELNKAAGQKVELGLEPGVYSVLLDNKGARLAADVRVSTRQRASLSLSNMHAVALDKATPRGEQRADKAQIAAVSDSAAALGAAVGAVVGSAINKAMGTAVNAAIVAAAASIAGAAASAPDETAPAPDAPAPGAPDAFDSRGDASVHFSFFPDLSRGLFSSTADHTVSINILAGSASSSRGFEVGGLANFEAKDVTGFQAAGLANIVLGGLRGYQGAGLANYVGGEVRFVQTAGLVNVGGGLAGAQLAGIGNLVFGSARGAQVAGVFNWARSMSGPQISVVNIADTVAGAQIGVVNIARHVSGTQVGVLNISQEIDGVPIGLFSIEARGRHAIDLWVDLDGSSNASLSLGTKHLYTVLAAGWKPGTDPAFWTFGLGLGGRSDINPFFLDYDLSLVAEHQGFSDWDTQPVGSMYPRLRAVLGLPLFGSIAIDAGVVVRVLVPYLSSSLAGADHANPVFRPSFILGVHI